MKTSIFLTLVFLSSLADAQICNPHIVDNWKNSRYDNNLDGTVTDKQTKLMWKRCAEGLEGVDCSIGGTPEVVWKKALELAEISKFAGYNDWRLPNIKELASLVKRNCYLPSINKESFPEMGQGFFWSSSPGFYHPHHIYDHQSLQLSFASGRERKKVRNSELGGGLALLVRLGQ
jgi:hypothetical protein